MISLRVMSDLLKSLNENPFLLAPMAGITDVAFRSFMREMGCGVVTTELVSSNGIVFEGRRSFELMRFEKSQRPVGIQLFGEHPEVVGRAAQFAESLGADFIDLNFGCPVPKVVKKGAGSAILKDLKALEIMLRTVKSYLKIPLTIKIRTGWDAETRNAVEVAQLAYESGITWVSIHGRTRAQAYTGNADWEFIGEVKAKSRIPIIGNGDVQDAFTAVERLREFGVDGVMIGRGCLKNPWIFHEAYSIWKNDLKDVPTMNKDFIALFERLKIHLERHNEERMVMLQLKKFAAWFSAGYPNSSRFRKDLFGSKNFDYLKETILSYYSEMSGFRQEDTSHEAFLMGGHG